MANEVLTCAHICHEYGSSGWLGKPRTTRRVLDGITFAIERGEVLGLVGESGCGKSTLARIILGLITPTSGEVLVENVSRASMTRLEAARAVQPVFQDPYSSLNPRKTIEDIIVMPLMVQKAAEPTEWRPKVHRMMDLVGLSKRLAHNYPSELSGGQRQRVAIARALINSPRIVVCDEPTSALDVSVQAQILNLLEDLRKELNLTYLLISHNLGVIEHLATRVAVMYEGTIVEIDETARVFASPTHPYTQMLLDAALTPLMNVNEEA